MEDMKVELYTKDIIEEKLPLPEFCWTYGEFFIEVNECGSTWRLLSEEGKRVEEYIKRGFDVATIWEQDNTNTLGEMVSFGYSNSLDNPTVTGFIILKLLNR